MTATSVQIKNIQIIHYVGNTKYVLRLYALYLIMIMTSVQINDIQIHFVGNTELSFGSICYNTFGSSIYIVN